MRVLRNALLAAVGGSLMIVAAVGAQADEAAIIEIIRDRAAAYGQNADAMIRLARCESRLNPNAVGDRGASVGLFQIHSAGLLPLFRQWGYSDRADPYQAAEFTARALAAGMRAHWHC